MSSRTSKIVRDTARNSALLGLAVALCCLPAAANEDKKIDWNFHGFASAGYMKSDGYDYLTESMDGSADFVEAGFNIGANLSEKWRFSAQVFTRELGTLGNYDPELDWLFMDWSPLEQLNVRAGRFKLPYGFNNETRTVDVARTTVLLPQSVYNERLRDYLSSVNGVMLHGDISIGAAGHLGYQVYYGESDVSNDGSVAEIVADTGIMTLADADSEGSYGGGIVWHTAVPGLRFGFTQNYWKWTFTMDVAEFLQMQGWPATMIVDAEDLEGSVFSAEYTRGPLSLTVERGASEGSFDVPLFPYRYDTDGWYLMASYRISDRFEVASYYSEYDSVSNDPMAPEFAGYQDDVAISLRADLHKNWVVKVEAHDVDGVALLRPHEIALGDMEAGWRYYLAKVSFFF